MLTLKQTPVADALDNQIESVLDQMNTLTADDPQYAIMVDQLTKLYALKDPKKSKNATELKDWIPVIASVGGIVVIATFEAFGHTVTSKALGFVSKPR